MMISTHLPRFSLLRSRIVLTGVLAIAAVITGLAPQPGQDGIPTFYSAAQAQDASTIQKYARVAYEIERRREQLESTVRSMMNGNLPDNVCQQQNIPGGVRQICNCFAQRSGEILGQYGLDATVFNDITNRKQSDPGLNKRIDDEIGQIHQREWNQKKDIQCR